jgi:hypothetical protein
LPLQFRCASCTSHKVWYQHVCPFSMLPSNPSSSPLFTHNLCMMWKRVSHFQPSLRYPAITSPQLKCTLCCGNNHPVVFASPLRAEASWCKYFETEIHLFLAKNFKFWSLHSLSRCFLYSFLRSRLVLVNGFRPSFGPLETVNTPFK